LVCDLWCSICTSRIRRRESNIAKHKQTFILFAYPTRVQGNVVSPGVNEFLTTQHGKNRQGQVDFARNSATHFTLFF
jgi:hypothetical protein